MELGQSWGRVGAELAWRWQKASRQGQMEVEGGGDGAGGRQRGEKKKRARGRLYHDITPLLCHYVVDGAEKHLLVSMKRESCKLYTTLPHPKDQSKNEAQPIGTEQSNVLGAH